jgi:hypothetical protein
MFNQSNGDKKPKYESLTVKEQMMGIKSSKSLPEDFYEKVLECELSLKEKFDMQILGTLIQYYSLAVEHFGSIGDEKKCAEYNESLNLLFKQMEIRKYMKEGKNIEINAKKEEIKKEMKIAENKIDTESVKKIIKEKENKQIKAKNSIILKEIFNQAMSFKQKLENKKKKYKLKLSNLENNNSSMISKDKKSINKLPILKNINDDNPINKKRISKSEKYRKNKKLFEESTYDNTFHNSFKSEKKLIIKDISKIKSKSLLNSNDISYEKIKNEFIEADDLSSIDLNIYDDSSDMKINLISQSSKTLPALNKTDDITKITEKKNFQKKIKAIISQYMNEYYLFYMKNTIEKIVKDYEKYSYNISEELINEEVNFYNQERQMEYLRDEDESYKDQIEGTLENIKSEKEKKLNDIYEKYNENIKIINDKYLSDSNNNLNSNKIEILKEKLKLELTKEINNSVLK